MNACRSLVLLLVASLPAQTTWIVDRGGSPGAHFADLPPAVAAAAPGDTILVRADAFLQPYSPFTTGKGLRVIGLDQPLLSTAHAAVRIQGVAASQRFVLAGFDAPRDQDLRVAVADCAGPVHLENLHAVEPGFFLPSSAAIDIARCALVTLRDVEGFGLPAVEIRASTVVLAACRLGVTSLGLGGGPPLWASDSHVDIVESRLQATGATESAVRLVRCRSRIGGTASAVLQGGPWPGTGGAAPAIYEAGGTLRLDPRVQLNPLAGTPAIVAGPGFVSGSVAACVTSRAAPGAPLQATVVGGGGDLVLLALGFPAPPYATPFGDAFLLPGPVDLVFAGTLPPGGQIGVPLGTVPVSFPRGEVFGLQPVTADGSAIRLGVAAAFAVH